MACCRRGFRQENRVPCFSLSSQSLAPGQGGAGGGGGPAPGPAGRAAAGCIRRRAGGERGVGARRGATGHRGRRAAVAVRGHRLRHAGPPLLRQGAPAASCGPILMHCPMSTRSCLFACDLNAVRCGKDAYRLVISQKVSCNHVSHVMPCGAMQVASR